LIKKNDYRSLKLRKAVSYLIPIVIFALSLWFLNRRLHLIQLQGMPSSFAELAPGSVLLALAFTFLSYTALMGYDFLAMQYIGQSVSYREIAKSSFTSTSISYNIGFNPLTGGYLRYRSYSAYGLTVLQIGKVITFCSITFWAGICFIGGLLLCFYPLELPPSAFMTLSTLRIAGGILLLALAFYLALCLQHRIIRIKGEDMRFPDIRTALSQVMISSLDSIFAGSALYFLLSQYGEISFTYVLAMFLIAQIAAYLSTVPGGLGVFEAIMIFALAPYAATSDVIVALLLFRGVYYITPLLIGTAILSYGEFNARRNILVKLHKNTLKLSAFTPQVFSVLIFFAGVVLLFSEALPPQIEGMRIIARIVPLPLIEGSSLLSSMIGVLLLILANGLWKRVDGSYIMSVAILFMGSIFSILKGFNYAESIILFIIFLLLLPNRKHFYRRSSLLDQSFSRDNIIAIAVVIISFIWLGLFAHEHIEYSERLLWQFGTDLHVPRFLRSVVAAIFILSVIGMIKLLGGSSRGLELPGEEEMARAREIAYTSKDTNGYLALLKDKYLMFDEPKDAFLMYGVSGNSWVCMGDPLGKCGHMKELIWDFHEMANLHQGWTVFYEISEKFIPYYLDIGLTLIKIGEEGKVPLSSFSMEGSAGKDFRYCVKRMEEKEGYHFEIIQPEDVAAYAIELESISNAWLETKNTREKGFSMGSFDIEYLSNFPLAVIRKGEKLAAFANIWIAAEKEELAIDLMRYDPGISNTTMEYLFVKLMLWGKENGYRYFSLGMSPLSGLENRTLAPLWNKIGATIFTHGEYFYNFKGLRAYKEKFNPIWEPRYIALPKGFKQMFVLKDVALLIAGGAKEIFSK
jgi:phosphatidylglycerol lysyltransferase